MAIIVPEVLIFIIAEDILKSSFMDDCCVSCGAYVPEGSLICSECQKDLDEYVIDFSLAPSLHYGACEFK